LFVCSGGGHLKELHLLRRRLGIDERDVLWATFDTGLSRSMLAQSDVRFIPYAKPRAVIGTIRTGGVAIQLLRRRRINLVVSTGANPAFSFFLPARMLRIPCHYIESATRMRGPSMTGRLLSFVPGVHLYTQSARWASKRWRYQGSVFDNFVARPTESSSGPLHRVVVTVGTNESYGFRRLLDHLIRILPPGLEVLWQTGVTDTSQLPLSARPIVSAAELEKALRQADVVIAHAGTGSALAALEAGKCPVLVPRQAEHGEHIDDHQWDTAAELERRGLAVVSGVEALTLEDLRRAQARRVEPVERPTPIVLVGLPASRIA
jgi:UDP-N-acetylglucosamine transferase subunit ALG13